MISGSTWLAPNHSYAHPECVIHIVRLLFLVLVFGLICPHHEVFCRRSPARLRPVLRRGSSKSYCPFLSNMLKLILVLQQHAGHFSVLRVLGFRGGKETLQRDQGGFNGEDG